MDKPSLKPESSFATCEIDDKALLKTGISKISVNDVKIEFFFVLKRKRLFQ